VESENKKKMKKKGAVTTAFRIPAIIPNVPQDDATARKIDFKAQQKQIF
jgi:hypothetical protein